MEENLRTVLVCDPQDPFHAESRELGERLGLTMVSPAELAEDLPAVVLRMTPAGLQAEPHFLPGAAPLLLDYTQGRLGHRIRGAGSEALVRAIGGRTQRVLDATGGLGRDAVLMARAGCRVTVSERHPAVYALLEDGLRRALADSEIVPDLARIDLRFTDGAACLQDGREPYDVVYLDPMFPERSKSAQVRKEQRLLQALAGRDEDAGELAGLARRYARRRVVVKRPKGAPELLACPHTVLNGKKVRFDIYLPQPAD